MKPADSITLLAMLLVGACSGCKTVVTTPSTFTLPTPIYLAHYDHDKTTLVVPRGKLATEYTYGDVNLSAKYKRGPWARMKGALLPTQGVLGRRVVRWDPADDETLLEALDNQENCRQLSKFLVSDQRLAVLTNRLERAYIEELPTAHYNPHVQVIYVEYEPSYASWHNSHHELASWLKQLGCHVEGSGGRGEFKVESARLFKKPEEGPIELAKAPKEEKKPKRGKVKTSRKPPVKPPTIEQVVKKPEPKEVEDGDFWPMNVDPDAIVPR